MAQRNLYQPESGIENVLVAFVVVVLTAAVEIAALKMVLDPGVFELAFAAFGAGMLAGLAGIMAYQHWRPTWGTTVAESC